ncbi:hypothetical protein BH10PLA1_BH10PLA1_02180 [soil metagenome]
MAVGIIGSKARKNSRPRTMRGQNNGPVAATPIGIASSTFTNSNWTIVFDQPVSLKGTPQYLSNAGLPAASEMTSPTSIILAYMEILTSVTIPFQDPAVRNASGGFVKTGTYAP